MSFFELFVLHIYGSDTEKYDLKNQDFDLQENHTKLNACLLMIKIK
jgi:hypothetical protein